MERAGVAEKNLQSTPNSKLCSGRSGPSSHGLMARAPSLCLCRSSHASGKPKARPAAKILDEDNDDDSGDDQRARSRPGGTSAGADDSEEEPVVRCRVFDKQLSVGSVWER